MRIGSWCRRAIALVGATVLLASAAPAAGATRTYTAQYSGDYSLTYDGSDGFGDYSRIQQTFTWTERVYTAVTSSGQMTSTRTLRAQGTLTQDEQQGIGMMPPPAPTSLRCTATELKSGTPYLLGLTVAPNRRPLRGVGVGAQLPDDVGTQLTISGPPDCQVGGAAWLLSNPFGATYSNVFPQDAQTVIFNDAFGASASSLPATGGVKRYDAAQTVKVMPYPSAPMTIVDASRSMHAVISTGAVSPPLRPPISKTKREKQAEASAEFRKAGIDALVPCAKTAKEVVAKTIEMSTIAGEAFELSLNALQPFVNAALGGDPAKEANECAEAIARMIEAYQTYTSADPPDSAFGSVALPATLGAPRSDACAKARGKAARICDDLVGAGLRRLAAQDRVAAVEGAIGTATNRLSTAVAAGSAAGTSLQTAVIAALNGELAAALGAQDRADRALAAALRKHHIHVAIVRPGLAGANRLIAQQAGVPATQLRALLGSQRSARTVDYSQALLARVPTAFSVKIAHTITVSGLVALYQALSAQQAVPGGKLATDLAAASGSTGAARSAALRSFASDARQTRTEAGTLLASAAAPLS
jgi:hypothetical protein